jgi:putative membrane protein
VRTVAVAFVLTGLLAMLAAIRQHRRVLRRLRLEEYTYREEPSIALATAAALALIGLLALVLLFLSSLTR